MNTKVTDWFKGKVKPVHIGVYERVEGATTFYSYWNGTVWGAFGFTPLVAYHYQSCKSNRQDAPWRGLKNNK